jgi:hypothetical protein
MHKKTQNAADLRLCVGTDGMIWFTTEHAQGKAHTSELGADVWVEKFLTTQNLGDISRIRIFGFAESAPLLCALYEAAVKTPTLVPQVIQIGTPAHIPSEHRNNPIKIFAAMDDLQLPTSCGGWHDMNVNDYNMYRVVDFIRFRKYAHATPEAYTQELTELMRLHPAFPAVSFVPSYNLVDSALLFGQIVDPRWFVDPLKPDRTSRLRSYMGMQIDSVEEALSGGLELRNNRSHRARIVMASWSHGNLQNHIEDPRNFLFRILSTPGNENATPSRRLLKACVRYLSFVRNVWLDGLAPRGRTLFVPEYFFTEEYEAKAYRKHVEQLGVKG